MGESVIVRQNQVFELDILAVDPHDPDSSEFELVDGIYQLTPYGMLLAGLGACTGIVLHTYAQYHGVDLHEVEMHLTYDRVFQEDCENCEGIHEYTEHIENRIKLSGNLSRSERTRLLAISKHCPIHKMLAGGVEVRDLLADGALHEEAGD